MLHALHHLLLDNPDATGAVVLFLIAVVMIPCCFRYLP